MKHFFHLMGLALLVVACGSKENPDSGGSGGGEQTVTLAAPAGLKVMADRTTETSLTFQWNAVSGAASYSYTLSSGGTAVKDGTTKNRNVILDGLTKATAYKFSVYAVAGDRKGPASSVDATTAGEKDEPNPGPGPDPTIAYADFEIPEVEEDGKARAFPGAEGGGMWTTGGRGGKVIHVTNLNDSGEGSLRWAINQSGPRTIVFDVAGVIELGAGKQNALVIKNGDVTIAGQTAPGDGICLKNNTFRINASNVIVRFIRCRMGDEGGVENDAMQVMDQDGDKFQNIIVDHCSVSWSTDECASFYGMKDFTFQWNIVSESLRQSLHEKGAHGYGGIWGGTNASYHHNLLAHHDSRNPRIDHDYVSPQKGPVTISNNVVYNWKGNTCYGGESNSESGGDYRKYNFYGNYYKPGPATPGNHIWFLEPTTSCSNCLKAYNNKGTILPGHFYMTGNVMDGNSALTDDNWSTVHGANATLISQIRESKAFESETMSVHSALDAYDAVLSYAGASLAKDDIDSRIATETRNKTATYTGSTGNIKGLIDTQGDVGGWPAYEATEEQKNALRDSDGDGIPDAVEDAWGLVKTSGADGAAYTIDPQKRYTNLEMYLHYLVKDIVRGGNEKAEYKKL